MLLITADEQKRMRGSQLTSAAGAQAQDIEPARYRLVIRVKIAKDAPTSAPQGLSRRRVRAVIGASLAALLGLGWVGFKLIGNEAPATPTADQPARVAQPRSSEPALDAAALGDGAGSPTPSAQNGRETAVAATPTASDQPTSAASSARAEPDEPSTPINEVIPDAPRSALDTIRGTVRVSIRVTFDMHGAVTEATSHDSGPSRYFERLALQASRDWRFTPSNSEAPRSMLLRFHFRREGVTARAELLQ